MSKLQKKNQYFNIELYGSQTFHPFVKIAEVKDFQDRDVAMLSALTMMSATLPNYFGDWRGHKFSPHLYTFFVGKSGTSKSLATVLIPAVIELHQEKLERYERKLMEYKQELVECKGNQAATLVHPKRVKLLFSAKTTEAAFFKDLKASEKNGGLLAASEADMFTGSMKAEHGGGLSEVLRQSFQHEFIDKSLSGDNAEVTKHYFILEPRLAVLFAGTPGQVRCMMGKNVENGLLNRFMFYNTALKGDVFSDERDKMGAIINDLKVSVKKMYYDLNGREEPLLFFLPEHISKQMVEFFEPMRARYTKISPAYSTVVKRLGLSTFRLMMIFCAIRNRDYLASEGTIQCDAVDWFMAKCIAECIAKHSINVNQQFIIEENIFKPTPIIILDKMPEIFAYSDFVRMTVREGATDRTGKRWINKLEDKNLIAKVDGLYKKIQ